MGVIGKLNEAYELVRKGLDVEIALASAEQKEKLVDAKLALSEVKDHIFDLKEENRLLKEKLLQRKKFVLENSVYWDEGDNERKQPFCSSCMAKGLEIPMEPQKRNTKDTRFWCPNKECRHIADPWDWNSRQPRVIYEPRF